MGRFESSVLRIEIFSNLSKIDLNLISFMEIIQKLFLNIPKFYKYYYIDNPKIRKKLNRITRQKQIQDFDSNLSLFYQFL